MIYLNPAGKPNASSFVFAFAFSHTNRVRSPHSIQSEPKDVRVQKMNDLEYDGPHEDGHRYLPLSLAGVQGDIFRTYAETMSPMVALTLSKAMTTARFGGSGIESLVHAVSMTYVTIDGHMKNLSRS